MLFWAPAAPITAISFLDGKFNQDPWILQYAIRILEHFPIEQVFFYIPQLVQALRYDKLGNSGIFLFLFLLR